MSRPSPASKKLSILCPVVGLVMTLAFLTVLLFPTEPVTYEPGEPLLYLLIFLGLFIFGVFLLNYNCKRGW